MNGNGLSIGSRTLNLEEIYCSDLDFWFLVIIKELVSEPGIMC